VNPRHTGTKAAFHYRFDIEPGASETIRLRLVDEPDAEMPDGAFDAIVARRIAEADEFYHDVLSVPNDERTARSSGARSPACCGASSGTTTSFAIGSRAIR